MSNPEENIYKTFYYSPIGLLEITGTATSITSVTYSEKAKKDEAKSNIIVDECVLQLDDYFNNKTESFNLSLEPAGSEFQKKVWDELLKIPYGKTITYIEQSFRVGDSKAIRAVAKANSQNNIAIIIPCHRVIGADGNLVGYAGGLWRKKWLIEHESKKFGEQMSLRI